MLKNLVLVAALPLAATSGWVAAVEKGDAAKPAKPAKSMVFDKRLISQYPSLMQMLTAVDKNCGTDNPCKVDVPVLFVNSGGNDFCLAKFPAKISWNRTTPPGERRIEWTLKPDSGVTRTFSFDADLGILPIKNKGELSGNPNGHGVVPSTNATTYFYVHNNGQSGVNHPVKYLSVIWLNLTGTTDPSTTTCGTVDPIIANDG